VTRGDWVTVLVLVLGTALALVSGARRGQLTAAALGAAGVLAALWIASLVLTATGWRDADGILERRAGRVAVDPAVGVTLVWGAALAVLLGVVAAGAAVLRLSDRRRSGSLLALEERGAGGRDHKHP
jgi:hypothetical protein